MTQQTKASQYSDADVASLVSKVVAQLIDYGTNGLPACYNNQVSDYLSDFYPELPWDFRGTEAMQQIIDHPEFETIRQLWMRRFSFDWLNELNEAIQSDSDGCIGSPY